MHGDVSLGGPVWLFATVVILAAVILAVFVLVDALRPARRAAASGRVRDPLWLYAAGEGAFLLVLALVQVLEGVSFMSALPVFGAPLALALGVVYLLRVVFPKDQAAG